MFLLCLRSGTAVNSHYIFLRIYLFVCCQSETERLLTQYYFSSCSPGLGRPSLRRVVLGIRGRVLPDFIFAISLYRGSFVVALRLAVSGGWRLVSSFKNS